MKPSPSAKSAAAAAVARVGEVRAEIGSALHSAGKATSALAFFFGTEIDAAVPSALHFGACSLGEAIGDLEEALSAARAAACKLEQMPETMEGSRAVLAEERAAPRSSRPGRCAARRVAAISGRRRGARADSARGWMRGR